MAMDARIKSTDLRIWNLVYGINRRTEVHLPSTLPLKILQIELFNCEVLPYDLNPATEKEYFKISNTDLSGIPLSEEWLKRFGFEKGGDGEHWFVGHHGHCLIYDGADFCWKVRCNEEFVISYIRFVHQLQNLYFALTGTELNQNNKL